MRTTLDLDDDLFRDAQRLTGIDGPTPVVHEALGALVERESARKLARLGGSEPELRAQRRRRSLEQ